MRSYLKDLFAGVGGGLFMTLHGSRLYGVEGFDSDWDAKAVCVPAAADLLLGRRSVLTPQEHKLGGSEVAVHAVQHFLGMLAEADTNAIDMLFAAESRHGLLAVSESGKRLLAELDPLRLVPRNLSGALGYARNQASKYSRKGERLALLEALHERLDASPTVRTSEALGVAGRAEFERLRAELSAVGLDVAGLEFEERASSHGGTQRFLRVVDKSLDLNAKAAYNRDVLASAVRHYGARAREARADGGRDLKAWYHALRVAGEAVELHESGSVSFPRPDAPLLRRVRAGEFDNDQLTEMLQVRLAEVERAQEQSVLNEHFDEGYAQELVLGLYGHEQAA